MNLKAQKLIDCNSEVSQVKGLDLLSQKKTNEL